MSDRTSVALQEIAPLVAGIGIGMLFHSPYQVLTRALRPDDIASATSAFFLVRFTGATCGLVCDILLSWPNPRLILLPISFFLPQAVAGAVFNGRLAQSDYAGLLGSAATIDLRALAKIEPISLRQELLKTVASAIQVIFTTFPFTRITIF